MDKTKVTRSKAPMVLEWVVGIAVAAVLLVGGSIAVGGQLTADLVLLSSAGIVVTAGAGMLLYVIAALTGAAGRY